MYGYIYKITNNITGLSYIGKHKYDKPILDEKYITSGTLINKSIRKYGFDSFTRELIDTAESSSELNDKEIYYIDKFNTRVPNGYNLTRGGDGVVEPSLEVREKMAYWKGKQQSAETKRKRSDSLKKVVHTEEWVNKIRLANNGTKPSEYTIKRSIEVNKNYRWYTNGVEEIRTDKLPPEGWVKGRIHRDSPLVGTKRSEETKQRISEVLKGSTWYNNGIIEKMFRTDNIPEGYVKGRLKRTR